MKRFDRRPVSGRPHATCDHAGLHSPQGVYSRERGEVRYIIVCDVCGFETREVAREPYRPNFNPAGNDPYVAAVR
jgi:hypothetical protein